MRVLISYNIREKEIRQLHKKFTDVDVNLNGVWTLDELYALIREQRLSIRAPIIDFIFFVGDSQGEGSMSFQDYLLSFTSFCALTKEEVLQLFFIILDNNRNGTIEKEEFLRFFSYVPTGYKEVKEPLFPVNNKNALDIFRGGKWLSLEFDGLAQLCDHFPYIIYPAFHVQEMFRQKLLGSAFWERLDRDRTLMHGMHRKTRKVHLPNSTQVVEVLPPSRCSMQEFLEYSRRKTKISFGKRVASSEESESTLQAKQRDEMIAGSPLSNMIRNPKCMYHVPYTPSKPVLMATKTSREQEVELKMENNLSLESATLEEAKISTSEGNEEEDAQQGMLEDDSEDKSSEAS